MKSNATRWLPAVVAPLLVVGAISAPAAIAAIPPALPERTPAQVLTLMAEGDQVRGFTAELEQVSDLGLPSTSGLTGADSTAAAPSAASTSAASGGADLLNLLASNQHARVQVGERGLHVQLRTPYGERALIVNRHEAWTWDYEAKAATHYTFPQEARLSAEQRARLSGVKARLRALTDEHLAQLDPQATAEDLIAAAQRYTAVSLGPNVRVANHAAYELVLTPQQVASLVRDVRVAIDAQTGMVLRTSIYAKAGGKLAYQLGYTSLNYAAAPASTFDFTPPPGTKVTTKQVGAPKLTNAQLSELQTEADRLQERARAAGTPAERAALRKQIFTDLRQLLGERGLTSSTVSSGAPLRKRADISGTGWASVVKLPAGTLDVATVKRLTPLAQPLGSDSYGLQTTLLAVRFGGDGSISFGSVPLAKLS